MIAHRFVRPSLLLVLCSSFGTSQAARFPPELSLQQALQMAADHPALGRTAALEGAAEGLVLQSRARPNTLVTLQGENWRFRDFDAGQELEISAFMSQPIELAGKRSHRMEVAETSREIAVLMSDRTRWDIRQRVKESFWRALLAQKTLRLMEQAADTLDQLVHYQEMRVREGVMAEVDLIKINVDRQRLELELESTRSSWRIRRQSLITALGIPPVSDPFELREETRAALPGTPHSRASLLSEALRSRLDFRIAQAELLRTRRRAALERSWAKPDPTLVFGYKRVEGQHALLGGIQIALPFFDKNRGNIESRVSEVEAAEAQVVELKRRVSSEVLEALATVQARAVALQRIRLGLLERAEETLQISLAAYQEQALDLLRLLDARNTVNSLRQLLLETEIQFEIDRGRLENAVGRESLRLSPELLERN